MTGGKPLVFASKRSFLQKSRSAISSYSKCLAPLIQVQIDLMRRFSNTNALFPFQPMIHLRGQMHRGASYLCGRTQICRLLFNQAAACCMILPPVYIAILCASLCCVSDDMRLCETVDEMAACRFLCNFQFLDSLAADELVDGLFINTSGRPAARVARSPPTRMAPSCTTMARRLNPISPCRWRL